MAETTRATTTAGDADVMRALDEALYQLYGAARVEGERYVKGWTEDEAWDCGAATRKAHDAALAVVRPLADALAALTPDVVAAGIEALRAVKDARDYPCNICGDIAEAGGWPTFDNETREAAGRLIDALARLAR